MTNCPTMNRMLGLLATVGTTAVMFVGCGPAAAPDDDDDNDGNGGSGSVMCPPTQVLCGPRCATLANDSANCGQCGRVCLATQACVNGSCLCAPGYQDCGTGCINTSADSVNCGRCGNVCQGSTPHCVGSVCAATCPGDVCGTSCVNLDNDPANCGGCGVPCTSGSACMGRMCSCPFGTEVCATSCVPVGTCVTGTGGTGGMGTGGVGTGGTAGVPMGGSAGVPMGGTAGAGNGGTAGVATGGTGGIITGNPPGWWTHGSWHGCPWTGIDIVAGTTTTNTPRDFVTHMSGMGYCVMGSVHSNYDSVALLGFNLNETPNGMANQCAYNPAAATMMGPPGVALTGTGIAVNFTKATASTLRIQIQGPNGATDPNDRWCSAIVPAAGPIFAPFTSFNTKCWDGTGTVYAGQPISAVAFLVPGTMGANTPFSYCINGFATGSSATDAPTWGTGGGGPLMGTIGGPGGMNLDFQRVKVAAGGRSYIIQNNNWGNPNGSDQTLRYSDNSFTVTQSTGNGSQAPASFPSIFIGANGDVQNGTYSTRSDDRLPKQISAITSVQSTFTHTGTSGQLNAAYDIWFSDHMPTGARYDDAISGFVMLWLYDPPNFQPIGSVVRSNVSIGGRSWNVWVGPRGATGATCEGVMCSANRPVVSYVATSTSGSFTGDLKPFFTDAAQHGIPANWYLTDVFAGFECWSGSDCVNKAVTAFTATVAP
jgi:hypothetical protein